MSVGPSVVYQVERLYRPRTNWSEVDRAFQVCEDADGFGLVALSRGRVVGTGHDDCELGLEAQRW